MSDKSDIDAMPSAPDEGDAVVVPAELLPKRPVGAPPGRPKPVGSGRPKGAQNRGLTTTHAMIEAHTTPGMKKLIDIWQGKRIPMACKPGRQDENEGWWYPSGQDQLTALKIFLGKTVPDLKSVELSGSVSTHLDGVAAYRDALDKSGLDKSGLESLVHVLEQMAQSRADAIDVKDDTAVVPTIQPRWTR